MPNHTRHPVAKCYCGTHGGVSSGGLNATARLRRRPARDDRIQDEARLSQMVRDACLVATRQSIRSARTTSAAVANYQRTCRAIRLFPIYEEWAAGCPTANRVRWLNAIAGKIVAQMLPSFRKRPIDLSRSSLTYCERQTTAACCSSGVDCLGGRGHRISRSTSENGTRTRQPWLTMSVPEGNAPERRVISTMSGPYEISPPSSTRTSPANDAPPRNAYLRLLLRLAASDRWRPRPGEFNRTPRSVKMFELVKNGSGGASTLLLLYPQQRTSTGF